MKCLQCGNELALLKKLTNGEFCSPEHRTVFYERMQKVAAERLAISAYRLNLKTKLPLPKELAEEIERKRREAEKVPAFGNFLPTEVPAIRECTFGLWLAVEFDNSDLLIVPPTLTYRCAGGEQRVCGPVVEYLHPQKSERRFSKIAVECLAPTAKAVHAEHVLSSVAQKIRLAAGVATRSDPVRSTQAPDTRLHDAEFFAFHSTPAQPDLESTPGSAALISLPRMQRLEGPDSRLSDVSLHGNPAPASHANGAITPGHDPGTSTSTLRSAGPFRMRPRGPVADENLAPYESVQATETVSPANPELRSLLQAKRGLAPSAIDRPFRMRPRAGVDDPAMGRFEQVHARAEQLRPEAVIPESFAGPTSAMGPCVHEKAASIAPSAGVDSCAGPHLTVDAADRPSFSNRPQVYPVDVPAADLAPRHLDRFFRMRPRGPLESASVPSHVAVDPSLPERMEPSAALPATAFEHRANRAPVYVFRAIRLRPRGPVACAAVADLARTANEVETLQSAPERGSLPAGILLPCAPNAVEKPFKMRPRGPVHDEGLPSSEVVPAGAPESLMSSAECGKLPADVLPGCAPNLLDRTFRMRPRGPVHCDLPAHVAVDPQQPEHVQCAPSRPGLRVSETCDLQPVPVHKPIRLRPRGPVACASLLNLAGSSNSIESLQSAPARGKVPAGILAECAPALVDRTFRMRPRGPLADATLAVIEAIPAGVGEQFPSQPGRGTLPAGILVACAPNLVEKPFRMRPRGPVASHAENQYEAISAHATQAAAARASHPAIPSGILADCDPVLAGRPFRMRPRAGITDTALSQFDRLNPGDLLALSRTPANPGLQTRTTAEGEVAFLDRTFRMRPRGPVQDHSVVGMSQIATAAAEPRTTAPAICRYLADDRAQHEPAPLDRPLMSEPRSGVLASAISRFHSLPSSQLIAQTKANNVSPLIATARAQLVPVFLDRVYRMRPRGPVSSAPDVLHLDTGAIELVLPMPVMPAMPAVLMRQATMTFREKPIKMKPRGPKPGSTASSQPIDPAAVDQDSAAAASCSALSSADVLSHIISIRGDSVLHVDEIVALKVEATAPLSCAPAIESLAFELEIYAQTLSDCLKPAAMFEPVFSTELEQVPVLRHAVGPRPVVCALACPTAPTAPAQRLLDNTSDVLSGIRDVIAQREKRHGWSMLAAITEFWRTMRLDQKLATAVGLLMIVVVIHSLTAGIPPAAVKPLKTNLQTADVTPNPIPPLIDAKDAAESKWNEMQPSIRNRSSIDLLEDFSNGLENWDGGPAGLTRWVPAQANTAVGNLGLYKPSIGLSDYDLEFSAEISKKSLGFVFRAVDRKNYYAVRIETIKSGRMRTIYLVRYPVIRGKEGPKTKVPLPTTVSSDTVLHVGLNVKDQFFTLTVDGKVADFWTDGQLKSGGVGFFTSAGEQARLRNIRVAHQNDALGKLCSFLSTQDTKH